MNYTKNSFTVTSPGTQTYADSWERTFRSDRCAEESMEQKPSVGRTVHYQAHGSPDGTHKSVARAAVITEVNDLTPRLVSLCVLNPTGLYFNQNCPFDDSETPMGGTWRWPPRV